MAWPLKYCISGKMSGKSMDSERYRKHKNVAACFKKMNRNKNMKKIQVVGVAGAGAMGRGIVQIAAQSGLTVRLFDVQPKALEAARESLAATWATLSAKGKITPEHAQQALANVHLANEIQALADCDLVIEAIVERLDIKQQFFRDLEDVVSQDCLLVSNTSSLSITSIAAACKHPERVAGYHFFNPVPLMKVVEVIDGLKSDPLVGDALMELTHRMGHTPVRAKDMPGFIVNHAGRGMGTEGLRIAQETVASFSTIDAIMREQAGFKMGPFELMDLTGLDVSHAVMESIYRQFFDEPRFKPSPIGTVRVAGGMFGRKTQAGFYDYADGQKQVVIEPPAPEQHSVAKVWVSHAHALGHARAAKLLRSLGATLEMGSAPGPDCLIIVTPYGQDVSTAVALQGLDAARTVGLDTLNDFEQARRRTLMVSPATDPKWQTIAHALLGSDNVRISVVEDSAGFVAQRIQALIVNIACDIAQQGIATPADIDRAVSLGLGYPKGPLALGDLLGTVQILEILKNMQEVTGDPRYRPSLWLQRRVQLGMSLLQTRTAG
jgi:3-hydroxybutyryl-CoA dehydrogenase